MPHKTLHDQATQFLRSVPDIQPGYTVRVHERIQEGEKTRVQIFEGIVIGVHNGHVTTDRSFTVRKVVSGIGVEKVFATHSPSLEKIEVKKVAKVRRARLNFLRGRTGKAARMIERFTNEGEFEALKVGKDIAAQQEEAPIVEAPAAPETKSEDAAA
jgi:large subunit ribosomal protein L19